jgi:hypothetical protein
MAKRKSTPPPTTQPEASQFQRTPDCANRYANNVRYEPSAHDLTLVFGQSDFSTGKEVVRQHTAITIPWSVAKLALYYLGVNLRIFEVYNGTIPIPPNQIPPPFVGPTDETAGDPHAAKVFELATKLREQFLNDAP